MLSDFDPIRRILRIAFVADDGAVAFVYRFCPVCGVLMDEARDGKAWTCPLCGLALQES